MVSAMGQQFMTRMLVTRPEPDTHSTVARLRALDIDAVAMPVMVRQTLEASLPPPEGFAGMVLTSMNGARALADLGAVEQYKHLPVYAVGDRTAWEAQALGFTTVSSAGGDFGDLVNLLARSNITGPLFYPAGRHQSADLAKATAPLGIMVAVSKVYEMVPVAALPEAIITALGQGELTAALFYSRRTAQIFVDLVGDRLDPEARAQLAVLCLAEAVAQPLLAAHFNRISLADRPDEEAMMTLALAFAREQTGS